MNIRFYLIHIGGFNMSQRLKREFYDWVSVIVKALIVAFVIKTFLFQPVQVDGASMFPTLQNDDRLMVNKLEYFITDPHRGDIVILDSPVEPGKLYIKRVIGLGGEKVSIIDGHFYINDTLLDESYIGPDVSTLIYNNMSEWLIPNGYVFVAGDNRTGSYDSRQMGPVKVEAVKGEAIFRMYPFDHLGGLN